MEQWLVEQFRAQIPVGQLPVGRPQRLLPMTELSPAGAPVSPAAAPARARHRAHVLERREVAPRHFQLRLGAKALAASAWPGQFVHVLPFPLPAPERDGGAPATSFDPLLRRALSLMGAESEAGTVTLLFRVEGRGTAILAGARAGDSVDLIGPLGRPFDVSPFGLADSPAPQLEAPVFHMKQTPATPRAILVGGGVGVPPLVFLGKQLRAAGSAVEAILGARTASDVLGEAELRGAGAGVEVTTDDGSAGHHGRVTDLLGQTLARDSNAVVYACGPYAMLRAVARACEAAGVLCQVSLEEAMPCGIGVCNGCVVKAKTPFAHPLNAQSTVAPGTIQVEVRSEGAAEAAASGREPGLEAVGDEWSPYQNYRRICVEGPACWAHEIDWSAP